MSTTTDFKQQYRLSTPPGLEYELAMASEATSTPVGLEPAPNPKRQRMDSTNDEAIELCARPETLKDTSTTGSKEYEKFINSASQTRGSLRKLVKELPIFLEQPDIEAKLGLLELESLIISLRRYIDPVDGEDVGPVDVGAEAPNGINIPTADIVVVDQVDQVGGVIQDIIEAAQKHATDPCCYLDCEGKNLGRNGTVTLLSIYVPHISKVYIVDLLSLGSSAFSIGNNNQYSLKDILEDATIIKGIFDCRGDSDALFAHHKIHPKGILDIQLMDIAVRKSNTKNKLFGLVACIEQRLKHLSTEHLAKFQNIKAEGKHTMNSDGAAFDERPLPSSLLEYAAQDVLVLPLLYGHYATHELYRGEWPARVMEESRERVLRACDPDYDTTRMDMRKGPEAWVRLHRTARN